MVLDYYKLREHPFGVTPDARYLFLSSTHREALAALLYGVDAGCGFLALIARPGLGKTTLLFHLLSQLREKALTVFLFQTVSTPLDLLRALLIDLGVHETQGSLTQMQLRLQGVLLEEARRGKRVVVVIDEAQNLDDSVLELVRMLSNFETAREKLIQIVLSGQPQLADKIASPELEQLRQRVSIVANLQPFSREDTELYIEHRLRIAGYSSDTPLFTRDAVALIAEHSEGIPRNISNLCFNSLSLACALRRNPIDRETVREVIADLDIGRFGKKIPLPAQPEHRAPREVPAFLSTASPAPVFTGWMTRVALVLLVVLVLGGTFYATLRWLHPTAPLHAKTVAPPVAPTTVNAPPPAAPVVAAVQADSTPLPLVAADPSPSSTEQAQPPANSAITVSVMPGKTLLGICVASYGKCDPALLQEIRKLNPGLNNLDHIEPGQKILIPGSGAIAQQAAKASAPAQDAQ
jgi:type II secretory pathway predicted ATPase ExeA